jgi:hypothetical protein
MNENDAQGDVLAALKVIAIALKEPAGGEFWSARKFLDDRGIFNGDLDGERVLLRVAQAAIARAESLPQAPGAVPSTAEIIKLLGNGWRGFNLADDDDLVFIVGKIRLAIMKCNALAAPSASVEVGREKEPLG